MHIGLIGPLPPPSGGMANQTKQLAKLLQLEAYELSLVQMNAPYKPHWIERVRVVRAIFRIVPYLSRLWTLAGRVDVLHVLANSGWSWYLFSMPAILIARMRKVPVVLNYRGGGAGEFLAKDHARVAPVMRMACRLVVPSEFLKEVFDKYGISVEVVPNIIDTSRFTPIKSDRETGDFHIIVTRNLEKIYGVKDAIIAFHKVRKVIPGARLTVAGSGSELDSLESLVRELGVKSCVTFSGRIENEDIPDLYASADIMLNMSHVDNMPISILESLASAVPVVTSRAGGIPYFVKHNETALMVNPGDADAAANAILRVYNDASLADKLRENGLKAVKKYEWSSVHGQWLSIYNNCVGHNA